MLDPVNENIRLWATTKAVEVIGKWDKIERDEKKLYKQFLPQ